MKIGQKVEFQGVQGNIFAIVSAQTNPGECMAVMGFNLNDYELMFNLRDSYKENSYLVEVANNDGKSQLFWVQEEFLEGIGPEPKPESVSNKTKSKKTAKKDK